MNYKDNIADDEWEWYIGSIFSRIIGKMCKKKAEIVVEIAPGFRYKIAYALKEINFTGKLYIIDTSSEVLEYVSEKYKEILPNVEIICINKNFENSFNDIPEEIDLLLSNHSIDDMIISEFMQKYYNQNLKNDNFKEILTEAWLNLGKNKDRINEIIQKIFSNFKNFFYAKTIDKIVISQYKSNLYFKDDFKEMDEITEKCFSKIKELVNVDDELLNEVLDFYPFGEDERYRGKYLLDNTQNAKNWIVGKAKRL